MTFSPWQLRELDRAIPKGAIDTKPGRGRLSFVKGIWVEQEANRIFGPGNWSKEVVYREPVHSQQVTRKKDGRSTTVEVFRAVRGVRVTVITPDGARVVREGDACGTGEGLEGWHNAIGEAVTDATKIALARFGKRLGAELYFAGKYQTPITDRTRVATAIAKLESEPTDETIQLALKALFEWNLPRHNGEALDQAIQAATTRKRGRAAA